MKTTREQMDRLGAKCPQMKKAIASIGALERKKGYAFFPLMMQQMIGQQISTRVQQVIWERFVEKLGEVTPERVLDFTVEELRSLGISNRKAEAMRAFAKRTINGDFDELEHRSDEEITELLIQSPGVGPWTAEMMLLFGFDRPDVLSTADGGVQKGLRMLYNQEQFTKQEYAQFKTQFSPDGSAATLYLWAIASEQYPEYVDPKKRGRK